MRILQLDLAAFGPFSDKVLDLSQGRFGLHLIFGPNEAGKSSTLRALRQVLFGIDRQTSDDFRFPYRKLRLGATLEDEAGNVLSFVRLKKDKQPLRNLGDEILPDDCLEPFLGHIDEAAFTRQFGLDWQRLKEGGQEMIRSEGELGRILFAAGTGLTALTLVQDAIEREMRELFLATGSNPKINELIEQHRAVEAELRQVRLSSQEWKRYAEALEESRRLQQELAERKKELQRTRNRLERIHNAKRPIQKFREIERELESLKDVVLLPRDFFERRQALRDQLLSARQTRAKLEADLARIAEQIEETAVNPRVLDHAAEIESLYKEIGQYLGSVQDCPRIDSQREVAEKEARHLLKNIRPDFPLERVDELRIAEEDRALIRELGPDSKVLAGRVKAAREKQLEARQQWEELKARREKETKVPDLTGLKSALKRAMQRGSLEEELEEKQQTIVELELSVQTDSERLPFWSGTLEELEKIKIPYRETVIQFQTRFDNAARRREELEQDRQRVESSLRENAEKFEQLELDGEVPTEEDLALARELRDEGWKLILHEWRKEGKPAKEREQFLQETDALDLAEAFQKAVARADELSDGLRRDALEVSEKKRLLAERKKFEAQLPRLEAELQSCRDEWAGIENDWRAVWNPLGIEPGTPAEMREWLQSHLSLMSTAKGLLPQRLHVQRLSDLIDEHRGQLIGCLEQLGKQSADLSTLRLRELIELSQSVLDELAEKQNQRARLEEDIQQIEQDLPRLEREAETAEAELSAWQKQWAERIAKLGLSEHATPGQANAVLDTLDRLFEQLGKEESLAIRVQAMRDFNHHFESRVESVAKAMKWNTGDATPTQTVTQLHEELNEAQQASTRLKDLEAEQERRRRDLMLCRQQIAESETQLREMCQAAGCADPEDLPRAERDSARKERLEQDVREVREQILQFAGDGVFEEFLAQADAEDADALGSQLADRDRELEEVEQALARQIERTANEKNLLETKTGGSQAALAAEEKQQILAEMAGHLERYVQLRLAHEALKEGAERYRKKHQGPVLRRASELFSKLTCGSFVRLQNESDDQGRPLLVGIRRPQGQDEIVEIQGMSDGTADQLYLALRIASLEDWLDHHPGVPFVLDDILINFDDQRAIAALKVLAELSRRTQVIFFTHHQHLMELAEAHLADEVCFHHDLGQTKPRRKKKTLPAKDPGTATLF